MNPDLPKFAKQRQQRDKRGLSANDGHLLAECFGGTE